MIEQGLVQFIQGGLGSPPIFPGGFLIQLPKDFISPANPMAWTYRSIVSTPSYFLDGQDGLTFLEIQIDCHGYAAANAITLARAVDGVMRGLYSGTLPDGTIVQAIIRKPAFVDGFSDVNRSYVRSIEYEIQYQQI